MPDKAFRRVDEVIETDAKTDLLNDLVGIFGVNVVFNSLDAGLLEVLGCDLHQIRDFSLRNRLDT